MQQIINNTATKQAFIRDLIAGAHSQRATGINLDWETGFPYEIINPFMTELAQALHAATPPLQLSYDASSTPYSLSPTETCHRPDLAPLDRWISMQVSAVPCDR